MRWALILLTIGLHAETGSQAWLRYTPLDTPPDLPAVVTVSGESLLLRSARQELIRGLRGMTGRVLREEAGIPQERAIFLESPDASLRGDAFRFVVERGNIRIRGGDDR